MLDTIDPGNSGGSVIIPELPKFTVAPTRYPCPVCGKIFEDREPLRKHRIETHPIERPYLTFANVPVHLDSYIITQRITSLDVRIDHVEQVLIDGVIFQSIDAASAAICEKQQGRTRIELINQGYSAQYELQFDIITDEVAAQVEDAFLDSYQDQLSLVDVLNIFIDRTGQLDQGARGYATALGNYLVAIMAKGRVEGCHVPYEQYPDKLGEALDRLESIHRPFSCIVSSMIRLMLNHFEEAESDVAVPFLAATKAVLREGIFLKPQKGEAAGSSLPVDYFTKKVILFATGDEKYRANRAKELESLVDAPDVPESDKVKMHLVLLAWFCHQAEATSAGKHYARVRHVPRIRDHAELIYENISNE